MGRWMSAHPVMSVILGLASLGTGLTIAKEIVKPGSTKQEESDFVNQIAPPNTGASRVAGVLISGTAPAMFPFKLSSILQR